MRLRSGNRLHVASISGLALVWALMVNTYAGATDAPVVLVEVAASAVLATTAALAPTTRARWIVGLLAGWATLTAAGDSYWLLTAASPAVAYATGQHEPAATVAAMLLRYPLGALLLALALPEAARRRGGSSLGGALGVAQVATSAATLLALLTPLGAFIAHNRPYSVFLAFDVALVAAAAGLLVRQGTTLTSAAPATAALTLAAADALMLLSLLESTAWTGVLSFTLALAGCAFCTVVLLRRGDPVAPLAALPPGAVGTTRATGLLLRVLRRLLLPVSVLVVSTAGLTQRTLTGHQVGLVAVALALALVEALWHVVQAERAEQAAAAVVRDELTGAWNRRGLDRELQARRQRRLRGGEQVWELLVLDLDGFKLVNDTHGHAAGDEVLRVTVRRIAEVVGALGLVARLGGDEFVVVVQDRRPDLVDRLRRAVAEPVVLADGSCSVSTSIGAVTFEPQTDGGVDALLLEADRRMYRHKHAGRHDVAFDRAR
ncbi:GGDEF domain-containing protein [Kineococcus sp. SYSU DK003]|uniref:GGDEF domain-containing protein n=1 Tax=Kineococcus sp. SYSU DK003 TaxID=3383124 RepID=UPI003D7C609C